MDRISPRAAGAKHDTQRHYNYTTGSVGPNREKIAADVSSQDDFKKAVAKVNQNFSQTTRRGSTTCKVMTPKVRRRSVKMNIQEAESIKEKFLTVDIDSLAQGMAASTFDKKV